MNPGPPPRRIRYLSISPDGSLAIVGMAASAQLLRLRGSGGLEDNELWKGRFGVFQSDGQGVLFGKGFSVGRWDPTTGKRTILPLHHTSTVFALALDPRGRRVATGAYGVGQLWDLRTGNPIGQPLQQAGDRFKDLAFSPDGRLVALLMSKGAVRFWDAATGRPIVPGAEPPGRR